MHATPAPLADTDFPPIRRRQPATLQVNRGYRCNRNGQPCHVAAGPTRTEMMDAGSVARTGAVVAFVPAGVR